MSLLFQPKHIAAIRAGEKTATRRLWADNYNRPKEGSVQMAVTEMFTTDEECECYIHVESIRDEALGEMGEADADAEGGYTLAEFKERWREINGKHSWKPDCVVAVVTFDYIGRDRPDPATA